MRTVTLAMLALALAAPVSLAQDVAPLAPGRARARALGVAPGIFRPGAVNAITDVAGVRVGHTTLIVGDSVRTGVTAILPHEGNAFLERVPAAMYVGNGFGKLLGVTQVRELGELETPILLTCTLCVWRAADALVGWMLERPGMQRVRSINPVVGETNDGGLNAIRSRPVDATAVRQALDGARTGPVTEGSVGAGTGTTAFGWKGGIGTSSRVLPSSLGGWTVGVLVQSNFGGVLQVLGAPVGKELGRYAYRDAAERGDGSIMIVVATDAPLSDRNLRRLAARTMMGLARTGASASSGSGDYAIAFSTAEAVRIADARPHAQTVPRVSDDALSPLFEAVADATQSAIVHSLVHATTVRGRDGHEAKALEVERVRELLQQRR